MTELAHITNHAARADARVRSVFQDAVRLRELLAILTAEIQTIEDLLWTVYTTRHLGGALGVNLDTWGRRLRLPRTSDDDDLYRARLEVEQLVNGSRASSAEVQEITARLVGAPVHYLQAGCAFYELDYELEEHSAETTRADVEACLERASGSGVGFAVAEATAATFRYDTGPGYDAGAYGALVAQVTE